MMAEDMGPLVTAEDLFLAFEHGLPAPDLLSWGEWQAWRATDGRRPAVRRGDTVTTTIQDESAMWRLVMSAIHGPEWQVDLRALNRDAAKAGGSDGASQLSGESAGRPNDGQLGAEAVAKEQQDDGEVLAEETGPEGRSVAGASRSIASEGPISAAALRQRLQAGIDLATETASSFVAKIHRLAMVLENLGEPVSGSDLAEAVSKGEYTALLQGLAADSQVAMLKDSFNAVLANDGISEEERAGRSRALIELLRVRGQRVSASAERMFSTASNSPQQTPERLTALESRVQDPFTPALPSLRCRAQTRSAAPKVG